MYGIIYKAVCPMGKVYVGQTVKTLAVRKAGHKAQTLFRDRRSSFQVALLEHGFDNFTWEQIDAADTQAELDLKEKQWIACYDSMNPEKGYNNTSGGVSYTPTPEHRRKLSEASKNILPETRKKMSEAHKGMRHTAESRQKMSAAKKGEKHYNYGKRLSPETCRKLSELHRGEKHPQAKLTEADVRQIKTALANGERNAELARKYGVNKSLISAIKLSKVWKYLQIS